MSHLKALWQSVVHDKAHIWLVNAHAEGNSGTDHLQAPRVPFTLHPDALLWGHASMVVSSCQLPMLLHTGTVLCLTSSQAVMTVCRLQISDSAADAASDMHVHMLLMRCQLPMLLCTKTILCWVSSLMSSQAVMFTCISAV